MRKRIISSDPPRLSEVGMEWLPLERIASVEVTSEDPSHPIEDALLPRL